MKVSSPDSDKKIAYLLEEFLIPRTTFVTSEVRYLHDRDYDVTVYVAGSCITSSVDPSAADLLDIAYFSRPRKWWRGIAGHYRALITYPRRYARTVWLMLQSTWDKPFFAIRSFRYFSEGVHIGSRMIDDGISSIHTHFAGRAATAAWTIWKIYGIPYSLTTHAYDLYADFNNPRPSAISRFTPGRGNSPSLLKRKLGDAELVVTISEFNRRYLADELHVPANKLLVIRCGVDLSRFAVTSKDHSDQPVILSVGGLVEKKGHDVLLRACAYLKGWGYSFKCRIIGEGPLLTQLDALRHSLDLEEIVELCGRIHHSEIHRFHSTTDIFALACVKEKNGNMDGIPVALMEAMAMELPSVTTNVSGIPELIESGKTGFVVETGDCEALAERLRQLLDDPQLRQKMGREARKKILAEYDEVKNLTLKMDVLFSRRSDRIAASA